MLGRTSISKRKKLLYADYIKDRYQIIQRFFSSRSFCFYLARFKMKWKSLRPSIQSSNYLSKHSEWWETRSKIWLFRKEKSFQFKQKKKRNDFVKSFFLNKALFYSKPLLKVQSNTNWTNIVQNWSVFQITKEIPLENTNGLFHQISYADMEEESVSWTLIY